MDWKEEMRMGLKLIKDACSKVDDDEWDELCSVCPFRDYCVMGTEIPVSWKYDANGEEI